MCQAGYYHHEDRDHDVFENSEYRSHYVVWNADCGTLHVNPDILVMEEEERVNPELWFGRVLEEAGIAFGCKGNSHRTPLESAARAPHSHVRMVGISIRKPEASLTRYNTPHHLPSLLKQRLKQKA